MITDYESVRWLTEFFYDAFRFSDYVLVWVVTLPRFVLYLYTLICVLLVPIVMLHRGIADLRKGTFSIYKVIASGFYCYPGLLPCSRDCCQRDPDSLRLSYYVVIHGLWFVIFGGESLALFATIHDEFNKTGSYVPEDMIRAFCTVTIYSASWIYSITLLIWQNRFESKHQVRLVKYRQFNIYPSVIFSFFMAPLILEIADFTENFYDRWWVDTIGRLFYPLYDATGFGLDYGRWMVYLVVVVWMIVSCVWMVAKEILVRKVDFIEPSSIK